MRGGEERGEGRGEGERGEGREHSTEKCSASDAVEHNSNDFFLSSLTANKTYDSSLR